MASTQLLRTQETPTSTTKYTWSAWIKRGTLGSGQALVYNYLDSNNRGYVMLDTDDKLFFYDKYGGSEQTNVYATRRFKDTCAYYHIHIKADSSQASESDRFQVHINGVSETLSGSGSGTVISQSDTLGFAGASGCLVALGSNADSVANNFDGIMSHVHYVDGLALPYTDFGSTDATTGEWKINTSPTVSDYGNSGYFMLKDDNSLNDDSGKGNNFTASGTLTKTQDCPDNIFATINPLSLYHGGLADLQYGNTEVKSSTSGSVKWYGASTLAFTKGKFYCEIKNMTTSNASLSVGISMNPQENQYQNHAVGARNSDIGTENYSGNIVINNSNVSVGYGSTWTADGDICMLAIDADNDKFYVGKNGVWANSDNPSTGTGGYDMSGVSGHSESTPFYHFAFGSTSGSYMNEFNVNFGNGYFGTTAVATNSGNGYAGAEGKSIFNYQPPTNYSALSTKGLNQ